MPRPKRKADALGPSVGSTDSKKLKQEDIKPKAFGSANLLADSDSGSDDDEVGGALLEESGFKINEDFAKRFEYNKKREERAQLEEKFNKSKPTKGQGDKPYGDKYDEDEDSSSDEDEDDDGFLATEDLDAEISATLQAIRNKDPRVYDEKVSFYRPIDEDELETAKPKKEAKGMTLRDYHREKLLAGDAGADFEEDTTAPRTFAQEQEDLKTQIIGEMHAAAVEEENDPEDSDEDGFLKKKTKTTKVTSQDIHPSRASRVKLDESDVKQADKDPDTFLSNFMAARAWVPGDGARFQPLESDDEDEDEMADKFEAAYNLRFENPSGSNEVLKSYARDVVQAKSVRRDEPKGRKKQRELEREKKESEKRERNEDRQRLRKLKIEEMEERLQKIKKAAGLKGQAVKDDEWASLLDENWDDADWEREMNKKFGEEYYAEQDVPSESDEDVESGSKKKKVKKPKWDDDIDIKDLIPDFIDDDEEKPTFSLSDEENDAMDVDENEDEEDDEAGSQKAKKAKNHKVERAAKKKAARLERQKIEELVDNRLDIDTLPLPGSSKAASVFRYRETSPTSYGLTAKDILMADDKALNEWAGLKKLASFRDAEKKRKDKKRLSKKARLKEWRKETFGNEDGPEIILAPRGEEVVKDVDGNVVDGKRKKRSRGKGKGASD